MFHYERQLPSFGSIAANSTHTSLCWRGPTYRGIVIEPTIAGVAATTAEMATQVTMVRLRVDGVSRYELDADTLQDINASYKKTAVNGYLPIFLTYNDFATVPATENLAWGTRNLDSLALEVTLGAGATINAMNAYAIITPEERDLGLVLEAHTFTYAPSAAGTFEMSDLPKKNGSLFAAHLDGSICTRADLKINGVEIRSVPNNVTKNWQTWEGLRTPQTNYVHLDPVAYVRLLDDRLPIHNASDFRILATVSGAGTLKCHMFTVNQPKAPIAA